jgi:hypothetical protein
VVEPNVILPFLASALSFLFASLVFAQWLARRRSFQLVWTIGLLWYGISAGTEFWGSAFGWSEPLYRVWYLIGALFVAAYLGMGTVYLLSKTRFGYFVAMTVLAGGLFAILSQLRLIREGRPTQWENVAAVIAFAALAALAIAYATWRHRQQSGHVAMAALGLASVYVTYLMVSVPLESPGYALDPETGVPIGSAVPGEVRILSGPFNIAGAFALVLGALFSAYVFMPKTKLIRAKVRVPVVGQLHGALAVAVNFVASLPAAARALTRGELHSRVPATLLIALGGFIPGVTSGLNRFGITWSFFLGELLGVILIFVGFVLSTEVFGERLRIARLELLRRDPAHAGSR